MYFAVFSNEERGAVGSRSFLRDHIAHGLNIQKVINLDSLGYNNPRKMFELNAIEAPSEFKHKLKAAYRMIRNYFTGLFLGDDVVKIVGRPQNADLVKAVASEARRYSHLTVREIVRDDCG